MPQIPDVATIQRKTIAPTETIAREDISSAGVAQAAWAKAAQGIAVDFGELHEAEAKEELTSAQTKMKEVYDQTLGEFRGDKDYETLPDRIGKTIEEKKSLVLGGVKTNLASKSFEQWNENAKVDFNNKVSALAWETQVDVKRAELNENLNLLKKQVVNGDISESAVLAQEMMDAAKKKGYYGEEEAQTILKRWRDDTALAGISRIDDPDKQIEALNSGWAVEYIDADRRNDALARAEKRKKEVDLDKFALSAANMPTRSEALAMALTHPDNKYDAVRKTMDTWDQLNKSKNQDLINTIGEEIRKDGVFDKRDSRLDQLDQDEVYGLELYYQTQKSGVKTTDEDVYKEMTTLANDREWPALQSLLDSQQNFISDSDRKKYQDMVSKGRATSEVNDDKIIKEVFGTQVTGSGVGAKNRMVRAVNLMKDFRDDYKATYGKEPSKQEVEQAVMDLKSEYDVDWSIFDEPIVDADYHEARKLFRDAQVNRIKELSPNEYQEVEKRFGKSVDDMSQFEIQRHVKKVEKMKIIESTEPDLYKATVDLINDKNGDVFRDFDTVYQQLRSKRSGQK